MANIEKFEFIASQYDTPERIEIAKLIADAIRPYLINSQEKSAIDYGCGTGLVGMQLLDSFHSMLFIDASNNMIEQVKQKIGHLPSDRVNAQCLDLVEDDYPTDLQADYIIMAQILLHIKETELILSRVYDILKNNGHLIIIDFDKNNAIVSDEVHNGFEQQELINILKGIGFTHFQSQTFYHGTRIFMNKDASLFILDAVKQLG